MHQRELGHLISGGENKYLDFKRLLDISDSNGKSELVKDVNAIANSAKRIGYLIIGVDDDKTIVGSDSHKEEQIQQIVHRYIDPPVDLTVNDFEINDKNITLFQIAPTDKPHQIVRDTGSLKKGDVYIRHGTVTFKATANEIITMSQERVSISYILESFFNLFKRVESGEITYDEKMDLALKYTQTAIVQTQSYLQGDGGFAETRRHQKESELAELWFEASRPMRDINPELAKICNLKGGYWSNADSWENEENADISLKKVETLIGSLLENA